MKEMVSRDVRYYLTELERRKVVFQDKSNFLNWLFEYACKTAEWEGMDPTKCIKYIERLQIQKLDGILKLVDKIYSESEVNVRSINLPRVDMHTIEDVVRKEHGGGSSLYGK